MWKPVGRSPTGGETVRTEAGIMELWLVKNSIKVECSSSCKNRKISSHKPCLSLRDHAHMRRFPEERHFFAAGWQNQVFRPSRKGPRCRLLIIILVYIQNLAFVAPGFEGSKSQKIILKGLRTLRTWGVVKYTFTLGGSRTLQEAPRRNLSRYSEAMVHLLLLLPKQL